MTIHSETAEKVELLIKSRIVKQYRGATYANCQLRNKPTMEIEHLRALREQHARICVPQSTCKRIFQLTPSRLSFQKTEDNRATSITALLHKIMTK